MGAGSGGKQDRWGRRGRWAVVGVCGAGGVRGVDGVNRKNESVTPKRKQFLKKTSYPNAMQRPLFSGPSRVGNVASTADLDEIASSPWRPLVVSHGLDGLVFGYLAL